MAALLFGRRLATLAKGGKRGAITVKPPGERRGSSAPISHRPRGGGGVRQSREMGEPARPVSP
ncbi:MAG TPA: hypothetical protein VMG10_15710 [Gemmataceae bacterium]|nr:hypothetical protein [Gemmataceae bacterium]